MTAAGRQDATGGATELELSSPITDGSATTCQVNGTVTGWVYSRPFTITVDPNTPSEEKMKCASIVGGSPATITILQRGYDDTAPTTHGLGAKVTHSLPAEIIMDVERHIYDTTEDDHPQYFNTTRHATPTNHEFGEPAEFFAFGAGDVDPADVGTAPSPGGGANPARDDHVHQLGTGAVDAFGIVTSALVGLDIDIAPPQSDVRSAGVVNKFARADHVHSIDDGSITYAKLLIAGDPISGLKITDNTIPVAKIVWGPYGRLSLVGQTPNVSGSTLTVMHFDTTDYDDNNLFVSTSRFQVPSGYAGLWRLSTCLAWPADGATLTRRYIGFRVNGATIIDDDARGSVTVPSGVGTSTPLSTSYRFAVGDYVEVICRQDSAGTMTLASSAASHFAAEFVRPT